MRAEITPAVARALEAARDWTEKLGAGDTSARHLMLALLEENEGRVAELLAHCGVSAEALRPTILELPISGGGPGLDDILAAALALAVERTGERSVASEHVL